MTTTVTFSNPSVCAGGDHVTITVQAGAGQARTFTYLMPQITQAMSEDDIETIALGLLRLHFRGRTRAQIVSEFQAGGGSVAVVV
jgi:cell division GTPase FtsZ